MSKTIKASNVARGMILAGTGKKQVFQDRRKKRSKDARKSWQRDHENGGNNVDSQ